MRRAVFLVLALLLGAMRGEVAFAQPPHGESTQRLDGLAAVIGGYAPGAGVLSLYRSDVELRARLALLNEATLEQALGPVPPDLLRASLSELIGEGLIALESSRLSLAQPSAAALREVRTRLLGPRPTEVQALLRALGVSEDELTAWVRRRALVGGFLQANLEGTLEVSTEELVRLFATEPHPFEGARFEDVQPQFAAWLQQQRVQRAVQRWVESLKERTPHRVLASY